MSKTKYLIYCDGACSDNQNPDKSKVFGAYAYLVFAKVDESTTKKEFVIACRETTNNKEELKGVIESLKEVKSHMKAINVTEATIVLRTDSEYCVLGLKERIAGWEAKGWRRKDGRKLVPIANPELIKEMWALYQELKPIVEYVPGLKDPKAPGFDKYNYHVNNLAQDAARKAKEEVKA